MKTVKFAKNWTDRVDAINSVRYRKGQTYMVPDAVAEDAAKDGALEDEGSSTDS